MREVAEREVESWPRDEPIALHPRLQALTLEIILRAVFGLDPGPRLDGAARAPDADPRDRAAPRSRCCRSCSSDLGGRGPWARFVRLREETDALIFELIDERRREDGERDDVLVDAARRPPRGRLADDRRRSCATS